VRLACQDYIEWPPSITKITTEEFPKVMTTHHARFCHLTEDGDMRERREIIDRASILVMRSTLRDPKVSLQLCQELFDRFYTDPLVNDWKEIIKLKSSAAEKKLK
jgi:hypothetical protein